ncbi:MAG: hypothetical protein ACUVUF_07735 [Candidatus Bathycorpusculaceae bacterium]
MKNEKLRAICNYISQNIDVLYALIAITATMSLLVGRFLFMDGAVLFGDFVPTLEIQQFLRVHFPLWSNRNNFNSVGLMRLPYLIFAYFPFYIINAPAEVFFKSMITSTFIISGTSGYITTRHFIKKLVTDKKLLFLSCLASAIFYAFNPWVMDRVYHIFLLVTYSVLPLILMISAKIFNNERVDLKLILALTIISTVASTSPHSLFFIILLVTSLYAYLSLLKPKQIIPKTKNFMLFIIIYTLVSSFWLLPILSYIFSGGSLFPDYIVQMNDLELLCRNSNLFNVLRLEAYWQKVDHSPSIFPLNIIWIFTSLLVPIFCFTSLIFRKKNTIAIYLSILSLALIFLAAGTHSPTPNFYEWLIFDAPILASFGWLFRDPNKWTLLLPTAYSILFAFAYIGIAKAIKSLKKTFFRKTIMTTFTLLIFSSLFIYITPSAINYFNGPFKPLKIPSEIYEVNSWLEKDSGQYNVLWVPSYSEYGANWAYDGLAGAFELDSSAKPTFDIGSKYSRIYLNYFDDALTKNKSDCAASYLNPLNIRYIIFHNDSKSESANYAKNLFQSLTSQRDLELIKNNGNIYVFENKKWCEGAFKVNEKVMGVIGGFDKFIALNALKPFNLSDYSIIFLDQTFPYANVNFDAFILSGNPLNDALSFFVNESFTLAPFDFCRRHDPANCWSKGSLSDLSGGPFHPNLENFKIECWDFDYDKGVVFTWASSARLDMPFSFGSNGNFSLFLRVFENVAGGKVSVYVDGSPFGTSINTQSQVNRFLWIDVGILNLTSGRHVLTLENVEGLNAVNLVAFMPVGKVLELNDKMGVMFQGKDLLYVLEAETDMVRGSASVLNGGYEASNGGVVLLTNNSSLSGSLELLCDGNYSFAFRGMGDLLLTVDNKSYNVSLEQFGWEMFNSVNLGSGVHQIKVLSSSINETGCVDVLWLWKQNGNGSQGNGLARVLSVEEIDSTRFVVELEVDEPSMLCFFKAYDPAWYVSFNGKVVGSTRVFGVANGFWIDAKGKVFVTVEFQPQKWFYVGLAVSLLTLLVCSTGLLYMWWSRRRFAFFNARESKAYHSHNSAAES